MTKLQTAKKMNEIAKQNFKDFEKEVLAGPEFKRLVAEIEEAALLGKTEFRFEIENESIVHVLVKILREANYVVDYGRKPYNDKQMLYINWW